jgi:predicted MFS family arabinose efflux permease
MAIETSPEQGGSLVRHRDFRLYWTSDFVTQLGSELTLFALPLVMVGVLHASGSQVGLLVALYTLPFLLLPLFVGVWQERRDRRPTMIATDLIRGVLVLSIPVAAVLDRLTLTHIYVVAFVVGSLSVIYDIAARSYLPRLVTAAQLGSANSKLTADQAIGATAAPGLGGWIAGAFGAVTAVFLDAISYFVSAALMMRVRHREEPAEPTPRRDLRREMIDGIKAVFANPPVRSIAIHAAIYNAGGELVSVAFLIYFIRDLEISTFLFGMASLIGGLGAITGALSVPLLFKRIGYGPSMLVALCFSTVPYFLLPLVDAPPTAVFWLAALGMFLGFGGSGAGSVVAVTVRQQVTPPELLARSNATYRLMNFGTIPIGALVAGVLVDTVGARTTLWIAPIVLIASVIPVANRSIWSLGPDRVTT